jgi:hypothetical protein
MLVKGKAKFWREELLAHPHICVRHGYKESDTSRKAQEV